VSDLVFTDEASAGGGSEDCPDGGVVERTPWRRAEIAPGVHVERALPLRARRTVGAWCFLDLAGPFDPAAGIPMDVGPHPHIGLQTVTWLFDGEVMHRDSLGSEQAIRPGELNLMTSGGGVVHSEHGPTVGEAGTVHLAQMWVALPESRRHGAADFEHHANLPTVRHSGASVTVILGEHAGARSPATVHTPIVGLDVQLESAADLPLDPAFEHAAIVVSGAADICGEPLAPGELLYLGRRREALPLRCDAPARLLVLGGEPFESPIVMWWNFVGRSRDEIVAARRDWMRAAGFDEGGPDLAGPDLTAHDGEALPRFPAVPGDPSAPIPAPPTPWPAS
jgi:redox-sensitive bicupin YhaK (pirin superfamily)